MTQKLQNLHQGQEGQVLRIDRVGGLGHGIGNWQGRTVFVPKTCEGDEVLVRFAHQNAEGIWGEMLALRVRGAARRDAPCTYYAECGGCQLQHLTPEAYRAFKRDVLMSALRQAGFEKPDQVMVHYCSASSRRRVEFKLAEQHGQPWLAFSRTRSHAKVPVAACLLLAPSLQALLEPITRWLSRWPQARELEGVRFTQADEGVDLTFVQARKITIPHEALAELHAVGIARVNAAMTDGAAVTLSALSEVRMRLGEHWVSLPPDAFLQASAEAQQVLSAAVLEGVGQASRVLDLFCGIGTFGALLAGRAQVHAVEGDEAMVIALGRATKKVEGFRCERRDLFKAPLSGAALSGYDAAIINPPRAGARSQCEALAKSGISRVVMVSCNPATWVRDARILVQAGYRLGAVVGVDQFVYSSHLELVSVFIKK